MENLNRRYIQANEVAERLIEILDDLHMDGAITGAAIRKKATFLTMLRAINHAERIVMRNSQSHGQVVVYAPSGEGNLFLDDQGRYEGDMKSDISGQDLSTAAHSHFLVKESHLRIIEIVSRHLDIYDEYPTDGARSDNRIRKISKAEYDQFEDRFIRNTSFFFSNFYSDSTVDNICYYLPQENRLVLGQLFDSPVFLQFEARLMPGIVAIRDIPERQITARDCLEFKSYKMIAPHEAFEYLILEAALYLLPMSAVDARAIIKADLVEERLHYLRTKPSDRNVIVPKMSFG